MTSLITLIVTAVVLLMLESIRRGKRIQAKARATGLALRQLRQRTEAQLLPALRRGDKAAADAARRDYDAGVQAIFSR